MRDYLEECVSTCPPPFCGVTVDYEEFADVIGIEDVVTTVLVVF
ncbi:hypothetical protein PNP85_10060 [Halobacterium salinarum]|nr:hypothetical protein [Halobacterium salinarum]